jgi:hypothetical protein
MHSLGPGIGFHSGMTLLEVKFFRCSSHKNQGSTTIMQQTFQVIFRPAVSAAFGFMLKPLYKHYGPNQATSGSLLTSLMTPIWLALLSGS